MNPGCLVTQSVGWPGLDPPCDVGNLSDPIPGKQVDDWFIDMSMKCCELIVGNGNDCHMYYKYYVADIYLGLKI